MAYDDDLDKEDLGFGSGAMEQYSTYKGVGVDEVSLTLREKATNLIDGVSRIYTSVGISVDEQFIDSIKAIEIDSLVSMLKQVKYAEHMLDSLMKRLDNGGYADNQIYDDIKSMQKHVIEMNLEVSKYTRLIPEFFKFTDNEVSSIQGRQLADYSNQGSNQKTIDAEYEPVKQISGPQFGTKNFLDALDVMDSMGQIDEILNSEPEQELAFDPADIVEKEDEDDDNDEEGNFDETDGKYDA